MYFKEPLIPTDQGGIYHLAPIPVYMKMFNDHDLHDEVFNIGFNQLTPEQKLMGQELPEQYDQERQSNYNVNYIILKLILNFFILLILLLFNL